MKRNKKIENLYFFQKYSLLNFTNETPSIEIAFNFTKEFPLKFTKEIPVKFTGKSFANITFRLILKKSTLEGVFEILLPDPQLHQSFKPITLFFGNYDVTLKVYIKHKF